MAMGILKDGKSTDPELLTWAAEVVRANSPTPLESGLRAKIIAASLQSTRATLQLKNELPPAWTLEPPKAAEQFPLKALKAGTLTEQKALEQWSKDNYAATHNAHMVRALQVYVRAQYEAREGVRKALLESDQARARNDFNQ